MGSIFSDFELSARRLATLLTTPQGEYGTVVTKWFDEDRRAVERMVIYKPTYRAIEDLHTGLVDAGQLRARVNDWRLDAAAYPQGTLRHNIRATTEYVNEFGDRELMLFKRQRLEGVMNRVLITASPQLYAKSPDDLLRIWLDCSEESKLDVDLAVAKCHVALLCGSLMKTPRAQVEVVHAASRRIVARASLPRGFEDDAAIACERYHRIRMELTRRPTLQPNERRERR